MLAIVEAPTVGGWGNSGRMVRAERAAKRLREARASKW